MNDLKPQLALDELLRVSLATAPRVLAGQTGLTRAVTWVNALEAARLQAHTPAPSEFILLLPPYADLAAQLHRLEQEQCAGIALTETKLPGDLIAWADDCAFPIIALTAETDLRQLQRRLLKALVDVEAGWIARKAELYQQLTRLSAENQGLDALARALGEVTRKGIVIHDKRLGVLAAVPAPDFKNWRGAVEWLSAPANLPAALRDRKRAAQIGEPIQQTIGDTGARLLLPISVQGMARGFLSLVHAAAQFERLDRIALEQGAAACALEMAKAKAISEAQKRLTGDLIEAVLSNSVSEVDAGRWAERLGYRRAGPHVALALQWASRDAPSLRRLETIVNGEVWRVHSRARAVARENEVVVFYALHPERGVEDARQWAQRLYDQARAEYPHARAAVGVGRPSDSLLGLRHSYREAAQALSLAHKLRHNRPQYFGDLGIYRLLLPLEGSPELRAFSNEIIGSLIEYDRAQGTHLLETLRAYFQHNANLAQTAQALYIHRNTLLYRLQRAGEIGKFALANPETRLAIQLALRAHELSRDEGDFLQPL